MMSGLSIPVWVVCGVVISLGWFFIATMLYEFTYSAEARKKRRENKKKLKEIEKLEAVTKELEQNSYTAQATNEALQQRLWALKEEKNSIQLHYRTIKRAHHLLMLLEYAGADDTEDMIRTILKQMRNADTVADDFPANPRYFNYEVEDGMTSSWDGSGQKKNQALTKHIGKGLRITAYNGFESRVIVPNEIDGQPVISIGEKVFQYKPLSEVILPRSIKAILGEAFSGCQKLKSIDLPEMLEYLDERCFAYSGLVEISFPDSLKIIPAWCCEQCDSLEYVKFGKQVEQIKLAAFRNCNKLRDIALPDTLMEVEAESFCGTSVTQVIIPDGAKEISIEAFGSRIRQNDSKVACVFLGKDTKVYGRFYDSSNNVVSIYCMPGSNIWMTAHMWSIPTKTLSKFRME